MGIIKSGICVLGMLALRRIAWGHIPRKMQYTLWIVVLILILINPFLSISSRLSVDNFLYETNQMQQQLYLESIETKPTVSDSTKHTSEEFIDEESKKMELPIQTQVTENKQEKKIFSVKFFSLVRWTVCGLLFLYVVGNNVFFFCLCKKNRTLCWIDHDTNLNVYSLKNIHSPFLFWKGIYVDESLVEDKKMMKYIITHESTHYKHRDAFWSMIRVLCVIWNWYNPFLWLADIYIKRDCELACDEAVMANLNELERKEYGYTLLELARRKTNYELLSVNSLAGNSGKLKERILMISKETKSSKRVIVGVIICTLFLFGCTFTQKESKPIVVSDLNETREVEEKKNNLIQIDEKSNLFLAQKESIRAEDVLYNSVKLINGYLFYSDQEHLIKIDQSLADKQILAKGNVRFGNFDDKYLYYVRYPSNDSVDAGIYRFSLIDNEEKLMMEWNEAFWTISNIYEDNGVLYIENNSCQAYQLNNDGAKLVGEDVNEIYVALDKCGIPAEEITCLARGYANVFFMYHRFVYLDRVSHKIRIYNTDTGEEENVLNNCESDVLISAHGIIFKDRNQNIYYNEWNQRKSQLLYSTNQNDGMAVNFGTYDENNIYGFWENDNSCTLVRISYDGDVEQLKEFKGLNHGAEMEISINSGIITYWENEHIYFDYI